MISEKTEVPNREDTRRSLIALCVEHGYASAAGHHASNIVELFKLPKPPADLLKRQMDGLQHALHAFQ